MKVEKSSFFAYFFSASAKKVRAEIILVFIFWHRPKNERKTLAPLVKNRAKNENGERLGSWEWILFLLNDLKTKLN
jgi:hypothetical protein